MNACKLTFLTSDRLVVLELVLKIDRWCPMLPRVCPMQTMLQAYVCTRILRVHEILNEFAGTGARLVGAHFEPFSRCV
jgi:hypothetical protein